MGDTSGDEAGTRTGVFITFREIRVELETCPPRTNDRPVLDSPQPPIAAGKQQERKRRPAITVFSLLDGVTGVIVIILRK